MKDFLTKACSQMQKIKKNSVVISFAASNDKSFEEYLLHPDKKKALLPVLAIYGANAVGKSHER